MATMWIVIAKNTTGTDIFINDLGLSVPASGQITLSNVFEYVEILRSDDLRIEVENSNIILNDGTQDLNAIDGLHFLTIYNKTETRKDFYLKSELQTPNSGAQIDWTNITDTPQFGASTWEDPVHIKSIGLFASAPSVSNEGDFYINTADNHIYQVVAGAWSDLGIATNEYRAINLDSTSQNIVEFDSTNWIDQGISLADTAILVDNDGDGRQAQYIFDDITKTWKLIAKVDFNVKNTLDDAYNVGGPGAGRQIVADSGAVEIDRDTSTDPSFRIVEKTILPTTGLQSGAMDVKNGILCIYDSVRAKWLSVQRMFITFGRHGRTRNQYLNLESGETVSNKGGFRLSRAATIVSMTCQFDQLGTALIHVRINDNIVNTATLTMSNVLGLSDTTQNTDLSADDFLQAYSENTNDIHDPFLVLEIAWRP